MADADRDSDLGDDSPVSGRSDGDSSGEQSCESSDEGVGRALPPPAQHQHATHAQHQSHQPHQRASPQRPEIKVRDEFDTLKTSLHPHLSSLASLAQGAPLSTSPLTSGASTPFSLPMGFPYTAPGSFLAPPAPPPPAQPTCSSSSSSSEGSAGWSFEEQYKQVRQLYEISDDPQRKEFLDDLFSFMQKRGTPINRLPIMAKSVLDLYELYNLVIARGGLVEVINKKLWQEIIKGLRLPSSITSAAFTLRTQYMKYLYDYECEKKNLSTRSELDAAIEGNKREGRRASGQYDAQAAMAMPQMRGGGVPVSLHQLQQHMPLSLGGGAMGVGVGVGGGAMGVGMGVPRLPPLPPAPHLAPHDLEYRVREYMKLIQHHHRDYRRNGSESPPGGVSPRDAALSALDVSRLTLWSLYNNNNNNNTISSPAPDLEPQREALNLSESPLSGGGNGVGGGGGGAGVKRECRSPPPQAVAPAPKRRRSHSPPPHSPHAPHVNGTHGAAFKITTRGDANTGDQQLVVSIELNGVTYEGVLFPAQNGNTQSSHHRQMVS